MRVIANFLEGRLDRATPEDAAAAATAVTRIYQANADFVWRSLQRLGIRDADLDDVLQEVFVVVHQRLHTFDGSAKMTTWLFGICLRVASAYRRRGFRRNETCVAEPPEPTDRVSASPEHDLAAAESRRRLDMLLDELELEKRAVFVMFEVDEMPCEEIAQILGVPIGTVYSRLHSARKSFQKALARMQARDTREEAWLR
ncbi:MAG: polymerase sigma factor RpoE [Labilithrix sp.]|nr:polymerase sigma factor RpoE [Labilithrix sp.]